MKIAVLNDVHVGARNSSDIFIEYQKKFFKDFFIPYLDEHEIKRILILGDYYDHRKYINFKALHSNRKNFLEPIHERGIKIDIIAGNHDVFYKSTNDLCSLKELLGYYTSNINIIMQPTVVNYDGLKIGLVPWINDENYADTMEFLKTCDSPWIGAHLELSGFELMKGVMNTHGMDADIFKRFEMVLSGHFHTKSSRDNIHYLGSQMEFTWADADDPKYFHVIDTKTRCITPIRNPITIFSKIYYHDDENDYREYDFSKVVNTFVKVIVVKKNDPFLFDQFIDKLQKSNVYEVKIIESFSEFSNGNMDDSVSVEDTPKLVDSYIDSIETDLDKNRIKMIMRSLYVEAQTDELS